MTHYTHIAYVGVSKPFSTLVINSNNNLYCNIIIYKLDFFIDIVILEILI